MIWKSRNPEALGKPKEDAPGHSSNLSSGYIHIIQQPRRSNPEVKISPAKIPSPLKILIMLSPPAQSHQQIRLFLQQQEALLIDAFYPLTNFGLVEIDFTSDSSLAELKQKLAHNPYHLLYFQGMGLMNEGEPQLVLENPATLQAEFVPAKQFVEALTEEGECRLPAIVFSFYQNTRNDSAAALEEIFQLLINAGLPVIISPPPGGASGERAAAFAKSFFWQIIEQQTISSAFKMAAEYVRELAAEAPGSHTDKGLLSREGAPVLYLRENYEHLCDWEAKPRSLQFFSLAATREQDRLQKEQPENSPFVGRLKDKTNILKCLAEKTPVLLKGPRGIGKTTLLEHLVQRLMSLNEDIVPFFFDEKTRSVREILNVLRDYLLEQGSSDVPAGLERYEKALEKFIYLVYEIAEKRQPLFIFDNLDEFQNAPGNDFCEEYQDISEIIHYLSRVRRFAVLCAGRYPVPESFEMEVIHLSKIEWIDFRKKYGYLEVKNFERKITAKKFAKFRQVIFGKKEMEATAVIQRLYESFNGNFRALELFFKFFDEHPKKTAQVWKKWEEQRKQAAPGHHPSEQQIEMPQLLPQLLKTLQPRFQVLLGLLSQFRAPVQLSAITGQFEAQNIDENFSAALKEFLKTLNRLLLVEIFVDKKNLQTCYYLAPGVRDLVIHVLPEMITVPFSHQRAGMYYFNCHKKMDQSLTELKEAFYHYAQANTNPWVQTTGRYLANAYFKYGEFEVAYFYASGVYKLLGGYTGALNLRLLGQILEALGKKETALSVYKRALAVSAKKENRYIESLVLNNVGQAYKNLGDYERSLSYLVRSLKISRDFDYRFLESENLYHIGHLYFLKGEKEMALELMEDSRLIKLEVGDPRGQRLVLLNISQVYRAMDMDETALEYLEESLELSREMKDKRSECLSLKQLANVYEYLENPDEALEFLKFALALCRETGDKHCRHVLLNDVIRIYESRSEYQRVLTYLQESLENSRLLGEKEWECNILNRIGQKYIDLRNYQAALDYLHESLKISRQYGLRREQARAMYNLAIIAHANGSRAAALDYFEKSLVVSKEYGSKDEAGRALHKMGLILYSHGDLETAANYLNESIRLSREINDRKAEAYKLVDLANFYLDVRVQQPHIARAYLDQALEINSNLNDRQLSQLLHGRAMA